MTEPREIATQFFEAFARRDAETMGSLYRDDATFSDPAFPDLDAQGVRDMWSMLLSRSKDLAITFEVLGENGAVVQTRWVARYTFSGTGRKVENIVTSSQTIVGGKIQKQVDAFDFWRWSGQALGLSGKLLGWSGFLRKKVQGVAAKGLATFREKRRQTS
ncbi:MAG: nuclear transport factor 2 family protein [Myxococcales bacterium]|nr:nuclear transport factor 2 family protein [Myxococcales bacterium]